MMSDFFADFNKPEIKFESHTPELFKLPWESKGTARG
jgi:hypothetical protein